MKNMKTMLKNKSSLRFLPFLGIAILLAVCMTMLFSVGGTTAYAASLTDKDYAAGIWFNADSHNSSAGWKLVSANRELWEDSTQEERWEYYLYTTAKKPTLTELSSVRAYHTQGYETTLQIGASYLTQEEVMNSFGIQAETQIAMVIAKIGGGWKWGNASSRAVTTESTFTAYTSTASGYYSREGKAFVQEYYLLVRKVNRVVNKDKNGNVSYGTYSAITDYNQSELFETFNIQGGVTYQTVKG
jgi:hypothetical protein